MRPSSHRILGLLMAAFLTALLPASALAGQTYWVTATGNDSTGNGSAGAPWLTLKFACSQVAADQGHIIQMGPGIFYDDDRLTGNATPASLPRNVSLLGSGKTATTYVGQISAPSVNNQSISDFFLDGRENTQLASPKFSGLIIQDPTISGNVQASGVHVFNMRIEGFDAKGFQFGKWNGLKNSSIYNCELVNNGRHYARGFGFNTGNLENVEIHDVTFLEERGKGGEPWNSGERKFTNVKLYNCTFTTHNDKTAGWAPSGGGKQVVFNFEWFHVDCLNVEVYDNLLDGSISLVEGTNPRTNKSPYSIRVHDNRWTFTKRYGIEASMPYLEIDHNYFHFGVSSDPDQGIGYAGIANFGGGHSDILIHHNVFENVPLYVINNMVGDRVKIYNNTVIAGIAGQVPGLWASSTTRFVRLSTAAPRAGWEIVNNVLLGDPTRGSSFFAAESAGDPLTPDIFNNLLWNSNSGISAALASEANVQHPVVADLLFTRTGDKPFPFFIPQTGSPLIDNGAVIAGITDGFNGAAPDIGAYETGVPPRVSTLWAQSFDSGTLKLTSSAGPGTNTWRLNQIWKLSSPSSAFAPGPATRSLTTLTTPGISIPPGSREIEFSFWHRHVFSVNDGGVMEVSADGVTWRDVTAAGSGVAFVSGGYTATIGGTGKNLNPLVGRQAWTLSRTPFEETLLSIDATAYAGKKLYLRWQLGTDSSTASEGWYLDDLRLSAILTPAERFNAAASAAGLTGNNALPDATPFADGVANLLKYAFNMNLSGTDSRRLTSSTGTSGLPAITITGTGATGIFRFEFIRRIGSGLIYTAKKSQDMSSGSWTGLTALPTVSPIDVNWERVIYQEPVNFTTTPRCFGKIEVSIP